MNGGRQTGEESDESPEKYSKKYDGINQSAVGK